MRDHLRQFIEEINGRDEPALARVAKRLRVEGGLVDAINGFATGLGDGRRESSIGMDFGGVQIDRAGAEAFLSVLASHPAYSEGRRLEIAIPIVGVADDDPALFEVRRDASELIALGGLAVGTLSLPPTNWVNALVQVAMGPEAFSVVLRKVLTGKPIPDPDVWGNIPDWIMRLAEEIDRRTCIVGLEHALNGVAQASQGIIPTAFSTGITGLVPNVGCDGTSVTIEGSGFAPSQPQDIEVYFPTKTGSCTRATVMSWTSTAIVVTAPTGVGTGCVGFVRRGQGDPGALTEATDTLAGEMERCIGMAASAAAYKLRHASLVGVVTCPPCLPSNVNEFKGGLPTIGHFTANGSSEVSVEPGEMVSVSWATSNASTLSLTMTSRSGPFVSPPSALPAVGSHSLGSFNGAAPTTATYRLTASNGCGTVSRTVTVLLRKVPKLAISAIEVVQAVQRPNNSIRLVQGKLTAVRVFIDSGLTGGFNYGRGPDIMPDVTGRATAFPVGAGQGFDLGLPWAPGMADARPPGTMNRNTQAHSLNFDLSANLASGTVRIDVRVAVKGHETDIGGPYVAFSSTTLAFQVQPSQEVLPILIADPLSGLPAPTIAQFFTSLGGATSRYPIADSGFIVNPPQTFSTVMGSRRRPLTSSLGWGLLLIDLATVIFLFPSTPVGGIRAGLVPASGAYAFNGMATPRVALSIPAMLAQNGLRGTFAHEMCHSIGLGHAPCPPPCAGGDATPPAGIDGRLPGTTDDAGMDVATRTVIPSGRGELMSYCGDTSQCPGPTRWPSTTTWDIVFGSLPI